MIKQYIVQYGIDRDSGAGEKQALNEKWHCDHSHIHIQPQTKLQIKKQTQIVEEIDAFNRMDSVSIG